MRLLTDGLLLLKSHCKFSNLIYPQIFNLVHFRKDKLPDCSAKKSLEEFEARKSVQLLKRKEYELKLKAEKDKEEAERKIRREEIMRRYSEKSENKPRNFQPSIRMSRTEDDDAFLADIEKLEVSRSDYFRNH